MTEVTAACIRRDGLILIARRRPGLRMAGLWEFPGGKTEPGETPQACLRRELSEEFEIETRVGRFITAIEHSYPRGDIRLLFYEVSHLSGTFVLHEHDAVAWVTVAEMERYEFAPADIPFVRQLRLMEA